VAPALDAAEQAGVVYATDGSYPNLLRFDLASRSALPALPLDGYASAVAADARALYVGLEWAVTALSHDGAELWRVELPYRVEDLALAGDLLFVSCYDGIRALDAESGALRDTQADAHGFLIATPTGRLLVGDYEDPLRALPYAADGTLGEVETSGAPFTTNRLLALSADGSLVVDREGQVFRTDDLAYVGALTLEDRLDAVAFAGERVFGAANLTLRAFGPDLVESGQTSTQGYVRWITSHGGDLFLLRRQAGSLVAKTIPLAALPPRAPPPGGYAFVPEEVAISSDGVVVLRAPLNAHLRRYSLQERRFLPDLQLLEPPYSMALDRETNSLLLAYTSGRLSRVSVEAPAMEEPVASFAWLSGVFAAPPFAIAMAHPAVVAGPDGAITGSWAPLAHATAGAWDPQRRRYLYRQHGILESLGLTEDGAFEDHRTGPYLGAVGPIRVLGEAGVALASDRIVSLDDLSELATLAGDVVDGALHGGRLVSLSRDSSVRPTILKEHGEDFGARYIFALEGEPLALLPYGDALVLVRVVDGEVRIDEIVPGRADLDGDGRPDRDDRFPVDAAEWSDRDGDGVGDNADAFPDDPAESVDSDGDGLAESVDWLPREPSLSMAKLHLREKLTIRPLVYGGSEYEAQLHFLADGVFALCREREVCMPGLYQADPRRPGRYDLALPPPLLEDIAQAIEDDVRPALLEIFGKVVSYEMTFDPAKARGRATFGKKRFELTIRLPHRGVAPELRRDKTHGQLVFRGVGPLPAGRP